jgi:hypothetical protein
LESRIEDENDLRIRRLALRGAAARVLKIEG